MICNENVCDASIDPACVVKATLKYKANLLSDRDQELPWLLRFVSVDIPVFRKAFWSAEVNRNLEKRGRMNIKAIRTCDSGDAILLLYIPIPGVESGSDWLSGSPDDLLGDVWLRCQLRKYRRDVRWVDVYYKQIDMLSDGE